MPRVKLSPDYWKIIARDEIRKTKQDELAKILGITQPAVCKKVKTMNFTLSELAVLIKAGVLEKEIVNRWIELV